MRGLMRGAPRIGEAVVYVARGRRMKATLGVILRALLKKKLKKFGF